METTPATDQTINQIHLELQQIRRVLWERVTFTTFEVAAKLGLDERTISGYCRTGAIESVQPRKRGPYLIPVSELDHILIKAKESKLKNQAISTKALNKMKN